MSEITINLPKPHPEQARILRDPSRFKVLRCGRRFGKTTAGIIAACECALNGGVVGWFAPTYKLLSEAWVRIVQVLRPAIVKDNFQEKQIRLVTGGVLDFWTLEDEDPARSRAYDLAIIDEAGVVHGLDRRWYAIRPTLADRQGKALFLGTPKGRGYFSALFDRGQQGDEGWRSWNLGQSANPYIDPAETEAQRRDMPPEQAAQELDGIPMADSGNPFGVERIRACVAPQTPGPAVAFGVDLARSVDYTVVTGLDADGRVCVFDRFNGLTWEATTARVAQAVGTTPALIDATGVGDPIVERIQGRLPNVERFVFTSTSKQELMDRLALALHGGEVGFPDGPILRELEAFEFQYRGGRVFYSAPHGLHDDCVMSLALAVRLRAQETARYKGPFVILPTPDARENDGW